MAVTEFKFGNNDVFIGLSTDTKSAGASPGDQFFETDSGRQFIFTGTWVPYINTRVNVDSTVLTLTTASAGVNSADQTNFNARGLLLGINVTTITGTTPTLTVTVQGKDVASGTYYTLLASTALNAAGFTLLSLYPGLTAAANVTANAVLPKTWRVSTAIAGTTPAVTATIGAAVML